MANLNVGTLAAGLGNSFKNIATAIPTAQSQIANAGYKGAQQRDLDWAHQNKVAQQEALGRYFDAMKYDPNLRDVMVRADMSDGQKIAALLGASRQGASMGAFLDTANARQQLATPEGVVQAVANLPKGMNMPAPPEAPEGTSALPQRTSAVPQVDREALKQRIANNMETIKTLSLMDAMINNKNTYGQANQYGYQPNNLIGGGNVVDPEMRTAKLTSEGALATQRNASASASAARAAKTRATPVRGVGRPRKGGGHRGRRGGGKYEIITVNGRQYQKAPNGRISNLPKGYGSSAADSGDEI